MKKKNDIIPFDTLKYCVRCCMPETQAGITFDDMGVCQACQSSEHKIHINWAEREKDLRRILEDAKKKAGNNYDCILPISGGKDSTFQMHVLVNVYHMKPLAVTFNHNWYSKTGWYNLQNALEKFNVDHIMFTPNRALVNRLAKRSLEMIGDSCWHCHAGVGAFPLQIAVRFNIPLVIWGESTSEGSGMGSYLDRVIKFDREYFTKCSAKMRPHEMICDYLTDKDLYSFNVPSEEEYESAEIFGIHLGDFIFWDDERQTEFIRDTYGWKETEMEGTYKGYKSAECMMPGVHDFTCYLKRGFGRSTWHTCVDVRNGLLTREEGFRLINQHDPVRPEALDYYLKITGMSEKEFYDIMEKHRMPELKTTEMKVKPKLRKNKERILPFAEQCLEYNTKEKPDN
jgi:N-acetyl sugar amidotransferase